MPTRAGLGVGGRLGERTRVRIGTDRHIESEPTESFYCSIGNNNREQGVLPGNTDLPRIATGGVFDSQPRIDNTRVQFYSPQGALESRARHPGRHDLAVADVYHTLAYYHDPTDGVVRDAGYDTVWE